MALPCGKFLAGNDSELFCVIRTMFFRAEAKESFLGGDVRKFLERGFRRPWGEDGKFRRRLSRKCPGTSVMIPGMTPHHNSTASPVAVLSIFPGRWRRVRGTVFVTVEELVSQGGRTSLQDGRAS